MSLTPPYSLLTRTAKGSQLTIEELDGNLLFLASTLSGSNTITGSVNFTGSLVDFLQVGTVTGSFSGDGSGLTNISATLPTGVVSSSLQFTNTDDVTFRNITASGHISSSGDIIATGTGSFNYVTTPIIEGSGSTALLHIEGDISASGQLTAATASIAGITYPTTDGDNGDIIYTNGAGVLTFDKTKVFAPVKNVSGVTLYKGTPVHASSSVGNANEVIAASASVASTMPATFVLAQDLADEEEGLGIVTGFINGVDTSAFEEGQVVYVGENGGYTNIKPSGSNLIQNLGIITKVDASNGSGYIYGAGRSNDTPNLLHNQIFFGSGSDQQYQIHISGALDSTVINNITASGNISASGNIYANTGSFEYVYSNIYEGSGSGTVVNIEGDVSASGYISASYFVGDGSGLTNISATLPAGVVSSSLQFTNTDDVTFRNITASGNISASGFIQAASTVNQPGVIISASNSEGDPRDSQMIVPLHGFEIKNSNHNNVVKISEDHVGINTPYPGNHDYALRVSGSAGGTKAIEAIGDISSSGTVIAGNLNIDATNASSSVSVGVEEKRDVLSGFAITSSAIVNQAYPLGNAGRVTQVIGDTILDLGSAAYPVDGYHLFYQSGSRECWNATGDFDLSGFGMKRTVGHQIQYGDGNLVGNAFTFNDYRLVVGEYVNDTFGGAFLVGRQSGSTYGANTQYAGFFASSSALGNPGAPHDVDKAFTIFTGAQTGPAFSIYDVESPDNVHDNDPVFSIAANGALGNVTASNISSSGAIYGSILTAAQIGITQVGMLTSLAVNGNTMLAGNVTASGDISSSGNITAVSISGDGSGLTNVPESNDIDVFLNFEEARSYAYIVPYDLQFAGFTTSSAFTAQFSSSGAPYTFGTTLNQFDTLSVTSSAAGLITLSGSRL